MAELLGRHWRPCGTSWTKFIWSFFGAWMGRSTKLGRHVCSSKTRVISVSVCGCHQNGWKEVEYGFHVWEIDEKRWSWRTNFISWPCIFGMYSTWMQTQWNNCWTIRKMFESRTPAGATEKLPWWWGPHAKTVAWSYDMEGHARKCFKRYCELANKKMEQLSKVSSPCLDDHQFKQGELESVGELSEVCSQIVLKCLYLARIGRPDISMVSEQNCSFNHQMDRSFWPTFRLVDFIHLSHEWLSSMLSCGKHSSALQIGFIPRLWLACDLEDSKSTSGWSLVSSEVEHLSPSVGCARSELLSRTVLQSLKSFLLMLDYAWMGHLLSVSGTKWLSFLKFTTNWEKTAKVWSNVRCGSTYPLTLTPFPKVSLSCTFLKTMKQWSKWSPKTKSNDETRIQNPQSWAWLVVRQDQLTEDPNHICWHQKPARRPGHTRKFFAWRMEPSSSFVQHYEFLDVLS